MTQNFEKILIYKNRYRLKKGHTFAYFLRFSHLGQIMRKKVKNWYFEFFSNFRMKKCRILIQQLYIYYFLTHEFAEMKSYTNLLNHNEFIE